MRAVLDTVIFVRALINPESICGRLLFEFSNRYTIVLSAEIVREIVRVLFRPTLRERFPQMADPRQIERVIGLFEQAEITEPDRNIEVCRDPADDKFFSCAVAGDAAYIVSEDNDILAVGEYEEVRPIHAVDFVRLLERQQQAP